MVLCGENSPNLKCLPPLLNFTLLLFSCFPLHADSPYRSGSARLNLSPTGGGAGSYEPVLTQLDPKEKMTYTEQAEKRKHCQRLTRYSHPSFHRLQKQAMKSG